MMTNHPTGVARVLITGSTTWADPVPIETMLDALVEDSAEIDSSFRVLTGMADGADAIAREWAEARGVNLHAELLEPGLYPGPMHRYNEALLRLAPDVVLAFKEDFDTDWASDGCRNGTEHMCRIAARAGVPVYLNGWTELGVDEPESSACDTAVVDDEHQTRWGTTLVSLLRSDITTQDVDVIVNAANTSLLGGGGVDGAIHRAAGPALLDACRSVVARQGGCATGEAVITGAGDLTATHVVHTVGPVWTDDDPEMHDHLLGRCYTESLRLAQEVGAATVAFPNISTGVYRFPKERAALVATSAVRRWLVENDHGLLDVRFVCFDQQNFDLYAAILSPV